MNASSHQQLTDSGLSTRILIVEDEALEAFLLKNCLNLEGYQVCELASSGPEAILIASQECPDIIIMDHGLSGDMNGFDAAKVIRQSSVAPILFLTGFVDDEFLEQIKAFAPAAALMKPCRIPEVLANVQQLLNTAK